MDISSNCLYQYYWMNLINQYHIISVYLHVDAECLIYVSRNIPSMCLFIDSIIFSWIIHIFDFNFRFGKNRYTVFTWFRTAKITIFIDSDDKQIYLMIKFPIYLNWVPAQSGAPVRYRVEHTRALLRCTWRHLIKIKKNIFLSILWFSYVIQVIFVIPYT